MKNPNVVDLTGRLPACDRYHPDMPSMLRGTMTEHTNGGLYMRRFCKCCDLIRKKLPRKPPKIKGIQPYGVVPLSWMPPRIEKSPNE